MDSVEFPLSIVKEKLAALFICLINALTVSVFKKKILVVHLCISNVLTQR